MCEQNSAKGQNQLNYVNPVWHDAWTAMFVVSHLMVCVALSSLLCKVVSAVSMYCRLGSCFLCQALIGKTNLASGESNV